VNIKNSIETTLVTTGEKKTKKTNLPHLVRLIINQDRLLDQKFNQIQISSIKYSMERNIAN
jgi:hypothetical protein